MITRLTSSSATETDDLRNFSTLATFRQPSGLTHLSEATIPTPHTPQRHAHIRSSHNQTEKLTQATKRKLIRPFLTPPQGNRKRCKTSQRTEKGHAHPHAQLSSKSLHASNNEQPIFPSSGSPFPAAARPNSPMTSPAIPRMQQRFHSIPRL